MHGAHLPAAYDRWSAADRFGPAFLCRCAPRGRLHLAEEVAATSPAMTGAHSNHGNARLALRLVSASYLLGIGVDQRPDYPLIGNTPCPCFALEEIDTASREAQGYLHIVLPKNEILGRKQEILDDAELADFTS